MRGSALGRLAKSTAMAVAFLAAFTRPCAAQERPSPVVEFAGGALFFPDDGVVTEGMVGGAARFYVLPRVSIGPEIAYIAGDSHSHFMVTGNVTFDFVSPENGRPAAVTPFLVAGGGIFRTSEEFPGRDTFSSSDGAFTAGIGVRALVGDRVSIGAEARLGWELHIRVNAMIGVRLGR
jgi:hypothetical protein